MILIEAELTPDSGFLCVSYWEIERRDRPSCICPKKSGVARKYMITKIPIIRLTFMIIFNEVNMNFFREVCHVFKIPIIDSDAHYACQISSLSRSIKFRVIDDILSWTSSLQNYVKSKSTWRVREFFFRQTFRRRFHTIVFLIRQNF